MRPGESAATLHVDLADGESPLVIDEVIVDGADRHPPRDVLEFLGLQVPFAYPMQVQHELGRKLWGCGRFRHFSLKLDRPAGGRLADAPSRLRIRLAEYNHAPLLTEELNDVDLALCKAGNWFTTEAVRTGDFLYHRRLVGISGEDPESPYLRTQIVLSSGRGGIVNLEWMLPVYGAEDSRSVTVVRPNR